MSHTYQKENKRVKGKLWVWLILLLLILLLLGGLFATMLRGTVQITLHGAAEIQLEYGTPYEELGAEAYFRLGLSKETYEVPVTVIGPNTGSYTQLGTYEIEYRAEWEKWHSTAVRKVRVVDTTAPVIQLVSDPEHYTTLGQVYQEEGFTASDNYDGDLTDRVERTSDGRTVTYTVTDSSGNTTVVKRTIRYDDRIAPVITLKGAAFVTIKVGETFVEPGYTASDDIDGNITSQVQVSGEVNTAQEGTYVLTYTVADSADNKRTVYRTVVVQQEVVVPPALKTIYLTFDDGPGAYTEQLLDILKRYGAKATFFVVDTSYSTAYKERMMQRMVAEGHTIAIHSASHQFSQIYASEEAYFEDLYKIQEQIRNATGVNTVLMRFPGGSSNTVSKNFNLGIMSRLTQEVEKRGFTYFDWHVDSKDAGGANTAAQVFANVTKGCTWYKTPVVLMHDVKKATVNAMEDILKWGAENGYVFAALDENSPTAHHPVNN